jgi:succinate dehydrogenase / fumarate reductase flavoprotein subunit
MQGLADGYFVIPYTIGNYLASNPIEKISEDHAAAKAAKDEVNSRVKQLLSINGTRTVDSFHRELGKIMWDHCGMARNAKDLQAAAAKIRELKAEFWKNVNVLGDAADLNQSLEKAGRVADFLELGELMCIDAAERNESCGGHFREEHQTPEGEAMRDDEQYAYAAAWEYKGEGQPAALHKEALTFEYVKPSQRSYK